MQLLLRRLLYGSDGGNAPRDNAGSSRGAKPAEGSCVTAEPQHQADLTSTSTDNQLAQQHLQPWAQHYHCRSLRCRASPRYEHTNTLTSASTNASQVGTFAASCCGAATCSAVMGSCGGKCQSRYAIPDSIDAGALRLTDTKHGYPHSLRADPSRQLHHILAHAHRLGCQEAAASHT